MSDEVLRRLNASAWRAVDQAGDEARKLGHSHIRAEHILLGLLREDESVAVRVLQWLGVELDAVRRQLRNILGSGGRAPSGVMPFAPQAESALEQARREALRLRYENIGSEHLLLGLMGDGVGGVAQVLAGLGAEKNRVRDHAVQIRKQGRPSPAPNVPSAGSDFSVLEYVGQNLTRQASEGLLGPVIGRDPEIKRVMDVLAQPAMNNPVLVGGTSAARTAVIEGLAQAIANDEGPEALKRKQLYAFSPLAFAASGQAGHLQDPRLPGRVLELLDRLDLTAYRKTVSSTRLNRQAAAGGQDAAGAAVQAAAKLSAGPPIRDPAWKLSTLDVVAALLEESRSRDDVVLFVDELPKVAGAAVPDGGINITPILKTLLASGRLQIIGAGTADEYRNSLDGDIELSPWLQPVQVTEPSIAYTVGMLTVALRAATRARTPTG